MKGIKDFCDDNVKALLLKIGIREVCLKCPKLYDVIYGRPLSFSNENKVNPFDFSKILPSNHSRINCFIEKVFCFGLNLTRDRLTNIFAIRLVRSFYFCLVIISLTSTFDVFIDIARNVIIT